MTPSQIVKALWKAGVHIEITPDSRLVLYPSAKVTRKMLDVVQENSKPLQRYFYSAKLSTMQLMFCIAQTISQQVADGKDSRL